MSDVIGRGVLEVVGDSTQLEASMAKAEQSVRRFEAAATQSAGKAAERLAGVGDGSEKGTDKLESASRRWVAAMEREIAQMSLSRTAYREWEAQTKGISDTVYGPLVARLDAATKAQAQFQSVGAKTASTMGMIGISAGQASAAMRTLPAQITDIVVGLQGGQAPLTVLLQQGGQLRDVFGGIGNVFRGVASLITPAVAAIGGAVAAIGSLGLAYKQGSAEADEYRKALVLTGNAAGASVGQLQALAVAVSASVGTQGKAAQVLAQLAGTGRVAAADMTKLAEAAIRLEREGGPAVADTVKAFAELGKNPTESALKLNEATNYLTVSVLEQVRALEQQGKTSEAARVAQNAYATEAIGRSKELEANLGAVEAAWRGVAGAAKAAWDAALDIGRPDSMNDKLAGLQNRLSIARRLAEGGGGLIAVGAEKWAADLEQQIRAANRSLLNDTETRAAQKGVALLTEEYEKARKANERWTTEAMSNTEKVNKALTEYRQNLAKINEGRASAGLSPISSEQVAREEKAIRDSIKVIKEKDSVLESARAAAKAWAKTLEEAQAIEAKAAAKTLELSDAQAGLVKYLRSDAYLKHSDAMRTIVVQAFSAANAAIQHQEAEKARAKALEEATKAIIANAAAMAANEAKGDAELQRLRDEYVALTAGKAALEQQVQARLELAAAMNEQAAAQALIDGASDSGAVADSYMRQAQALREQLELRERIASATAGKEYAEATAKAAQKATEEWQRAADDIRGALTDALRRGFESGEGFGRNLAKTLENELKTRIAAALADSLVGLGAAFIGAGGGQAVNRGATMMQTGSMLSSAYGAADKAWAWYSGGSTATTGASAAAQFQAGYRGSSAMMGAGTVGPVTDGAVGATGAGASAGSSAAWLSTWGAAIAAGVWKANQDWNNGFRRDQAKDVGGGALGGYGTSPLGNMEPELANFYSKLGFSDKWADALSGALAVAALAGFSSPKIRDAGITGKISGGDFTGLATATSVQEAGFVRKLFSDDKVTQLTKELPAELGKFLDAGAAGILDKAQNYGKALGLPVDMLSSISADIKIMADKEGQITQDALVASLGGYGDALVKGWENALKPLATLVDGRAETTAETLTRVGDALTGVNSLFERLGYAALQASVQGGNAAVELQRLFGGADAMQQQLSGYYQAFYTEAERAAKLQADLTAEFAKYGAALPATREEYRAMVDSLVGGGALLTESGREQYRALLGAAGAFDALATATDKAAEAAAEKAAEEAARKAEARAELDVELLRAQGKEQAAVALERQQELEALRKLDPALASVKSLIYEAADAAALWSRQLQLMAGVDSVVPDFLAGDALSRYRAERIQQTLATGGIDTTVTGILASTRDQILALWDAVGIDGKEAVLAAYGAWKQLNDEMRAAPLQKQLDEIAKTFGDLSVAADSVPPLSDVYTRNATELKQLEDGLAQILGTASKSAQQVLADLLTQKKAITDYRASLGPAITDARLRGMAPADRVAALRQQEAGLFGKLAATDNPVAVAQQLQAVVLRRISEESALRTQSNDAQIKALQEQILGAERLQQLSQQIAQFTGSMRFSDLSPLGYEQQLGAARSLYETTLSKAQSGDANAMGSLTGNAQAYLQEARSYYASSEGYAGIFDQVLGQLDKLGAMDPRLQAMQDQLTALQGINDAQRQVSDDVVWASGQEVSALSMIDAAMANREAAVQVKVEEQIAVAREQIAELKTLVADQKAQLVQQAAIAQQLTAELRKISGPAADMAAEASLAGASAANGWVGA